MEKEHSVGPAEGQVRPVPRIETLRVQNFRALRDVVVNEIQTVDSPRPS